MGNQTGCNPTAEDRIIALIRSAKDPQRAMAIAMELMTCEVAARNANQPQIDALPIRQDVSTAGPDGEQFVQRRRAAR